MDLKQPIELPKTVIKLTILLFFIIITYIPTFIWMIDRWVAAETYYSHGFLVPLISAFIIWQKRKILAQTKIKPKKIGWLIFLTGISIHALSALMQVYFSSGFSIIVVILGLILLLFGKDYLRQLLFPVSFLVFMIPLPLIAIANISFRLKILASQISVAIVNGIGIKAIRDGSVIQTAHSYLTVEDPCSGIRSLIAMIALGALMAYYSDFNRTKKTILLLSSIPIAILSNVIRIVMLTLVSEIYGTKIAMGIFHNIMGILVFVFAFAGLLLIQKILE